MEYNNSTSQEQKDSPIDIQQPYVSSTDACEPLGTVVPASMAYEQKRFAEKLRSSIKPSVHEFVMNRLNYTDYKEFCQSFGQEQIDAIANAIYNFENTGFGIIVADQTGVGKGRVGAGLIRYAVEYLKKMPIFVTDKKHLISDMYRDLIDINFQANAPQQVKIVSKEIEDMTDNQIIRLIKNDLKNNDELRIDLAEIMDDVPDDFEVEVKKLFSKEPSKAILPEGIEQPEDLIELIVQAYRLYLEINGLETYERDWIASKDGEYVINTKKGDSYDSLLKRELKEGRQLIKPFITFSYKVKDENGNILYDIKYDKKVETSQRLDRDLKVCMTTYSQFGRAFESNGDPTAKFTLLRKIALNGILILDESHKAAGINQGKMSNTARAIADLVQLSKDTIFISATFAKRPENMFLYAMKTAIREANLSNDELIRVFKSGGNALQEAASAELARIGHIVRRERPIVGKTFYEKESEDTPTGKSQIDSFNIFRQLNKDLRDYYGKVKGQYREFLKAMLGAKYKQEKDNYPHKGNVLLLTFNLVNQFLLGLKVEQASGEAIKYLQDGKKPVIAIANTMESIFTNIKKDYPNEIPYEIGDVIVDDLSLVFPYLWDYCFKYKVYKKQMVPDENGVPQEEMVGTDYHLIHNCSQVFLPLREELLPLYNSILTTFKNCNFIGVSLSPIDKIISNIESRGFKVGEVTGRKRKLVYDSMGTAKLQTRKVANVTDTIRDFNFNIKDALVLNRSGAVGVSMHSKPNSVVNKFDKAILKIENLDDRPTPTSLEPRDEVKQRVMIITQMELDVNNEVQKLGRISRTGQIYAPIYKYLTSCVPFEERFAAMMELKLRSLMATVSSDQESASSLFTADDYLSEEGGEAVEQPAMSVGMNLPRDTNGNLSLTGKALVDFCLKQLYFKSIDEQKRFFIQFQQALYEEIEKRKREGTYNKKMVLKQYNAETFDVLPFELGMENPFSSFGSPVFAERLNIETFEAKNFANTVEANISKSLQTLGDNSGNTNPIESLDKYKKYMGDIADKYLEESVKVRHIEYVQELQGRIQQAESAIEERKEGIKGYEKVEEALDIYSKIQSLNTEISDLQGRVSELILSANQDEMNKVVNEIQSKNSEKSILQQKFDNEFKEVYEKRGDYSYEIRQIEALENSIERLNSQVTKENETYNQQVLMCDRYKFYISSIGSVFQVTTKSEQSDWAEDDNGQYSQIYSYANTMNEQMVLTKVSYPFNQRKNADFTWGTIDLTFTPAYGGFVTSNLYNIESPLTEKDTKEKKEHTTDLQILPYDYNNDKWNELVEGTYTGSKGEKVFLTGSLLRAMAVANENKLSGNIVKFNTIDKKIKIGFELSVASSNAILPKFNDSDSFPIVSSFSSSLVKDVVLPYIIASLNNNDTTLFTSNFNRHEILLFEVLEKIKSKIEGGVSVIDDTFFVEFKVNELSQYTSQSNVIDSLESNGLDSDAIYVRLSSTDFAYTYQILDFLNVLNIANDQIISDGYARTLSYETSKGGKLFTIPAKYQGSNWDFRGRYNVPYEVIQYTRQYYYEDYQFTTGLNAFVLTAVLNYSIETQQTKNWYKPKFAIDLTLNDFCKLCDYLKELEMPMKTIVSYKMLKDSGKFTFDIESFQRATIVTDIDGEGNIQELISEEAEQSIDGLIDNLVELFQ
jgi:hypothetical protein